MMSTLSSVMRRCAFLVAVVVSLASLRMVIFSFSPAISAGHIFSACSAGMPSDAPGPVVDSVTPMWISACAICAAAPSPAQRAAVRRPAARNERFAAMPMSRSD